MFTLAHQSDPHLAPLPVASFFELSGKRLTGYLNWQRKRRNVHDSAVLESIVADMKAQAPNHIAVTGDIANIGLPEEYARGRVWLESLGDAKDVSYIPGNHDIYLSECIALSHKSWGGHMRGDDDTDLFPYVRRRGPLALIGLSSGVPTPPFFATGTLGDAQRDKLAHVLAALKDEGLFRVVMIHHPPVSLAPRHKRLTDADELKAVIAAHGAELLLHGHDHLHMVNWLEGPGGARVPSVGVPSASSKPGMDHDPAGYHLYRIDGEAGRWRCELIARVMNEAGEVKEDKRVVLAGS
jgi:3',5'-cyclic AMP phosphodiesterase CpdA